MIKEPFINIESLLSRLDPRIRVLFVVVFSFIVALLRQFPAMGAALLISVLLTAIARLDLHEVGKRLALVNSIIVLLWLMVPLTFRGEVLFHIGPLGISREGLLFCAGITLKCNSILLAVISLLATMSIATLGHAMIRLKMPPKLVNLLLMTYRYIFVMEQEYARLSKAAKIRGFKPGTNMHSYRTYAYFLGILFVRAAERAERVHQAMLCRGFRGKFYCLREFSLSRRDWIWSGAMAFVLLALVILEWMRTAT